MKASIFLTATLLTFCLTSNAQKKRIYYFADTVTKKGIKPLLEIGTEASVLTYYHFFIKVYPDVEGSSHSPIEMTEANQKPLQVNRGTTTYLLKS